MQVRFGWLVRVRWIDARPKDQAVWVTEMYLNQDVVSKLRHPLTLQQLSSAFGLC